MIMVSLLDDSVAFAFECWVDGSIDCAEARVIAYLHFALHIRSEKDTLDEMTQIIRIYSMWLSGEGEHLSVLPALWVG